MFETCCFGCFFACLLNSRVNSIVLFNQVARTGTWPTGSPLWEWSVFTTAFPVLFADFQHCALPRDNPKQNSITMLCLNTYHPLTQPFPSCICLVCKKPLIYTLLESKASCFWYSMLVRFFFFILHTRFCLLGLFGLQGHLNINYFSLPEVKTLQNLGGHCKYVLLPLS